MNNDRQLSEAEQDRLAIAAITARAQKSMDILGRRIARAATRGEQGKREPVVTD